VPGDLPFITVDIGLRLGLAGDAAMSFA